jgi:hypothetical protein
MRKYLVSLSLTLVACVAPVAPQGGSNGNDRSNGGEQGETLLTGAMVISPDGKFALMQRNQTSVLLDVDAQVARELPEQVERFVFAKTGGRAVAVLPNRDGVVMYDLKSMTERWRSVPAFLSVDGARLARLSDDGQALVLGDVGRVFVLDAESGSIRGTVKLDANPEELTFVPGTSRALIVETTLWNDHKPTTSIADVDLQSMKTRVIGIPNCTAPIDVLPDATRALLSPTFCEEGQASTNKQTWTNPDPVSVIDLTPDGPKFLKNLPGFGPVALDAEAHRAVAYLDVQRMDASMFDDKTKVPDVNGKRYHIMTIDPKTLAFDLTPVGDVLPRFAMAKNGKDLLVDATVQQLRGEATVKATIDSSGQITASVELFGKSDSLFGVFDLDARAYVPFSGPAATLDRFIQMGDADRVFTLKTRADGSGGDLYRIDIGASSAISLNRSLRDIGLLPDGKTMLLRERLPAVQVTTSSGIDWYRHERYCFSLDGVTCTSSVELTDSKPFQSGPACKDYHDC